MKILRYQKVKFKSHRETYNFNFCCCCCSSWLLLCLKKTYKINLMGCCCCYAYLLMNPFRAHPVSIQTKFVSCHAQETFLERKWKILVRWNFTIIIIKSNFKSLKANHSKVIVRLFFYLFFRCHKYNVVVMEFEFYLLKIESHKQNIE